MQQQQYLHLHRHGMEQHGYQLLKLGLSMEVNVDLHVRQITHGIQLIQYVKQIQGIQNHVQEVFPSMQQQKHDMEHLNRHGTEQHGHQQVCHGQMMEVNVDSHVIQITHGIQLI